MTRRDFSEGVISKVDKDRRSDARRARDARVTADARMATTTAIYRVPSSDLVRHCDGVLDAVRDVLNATIGPASASSRIAACAEQAIISGPNARVRAEQLFASSDGPQHIGFALATGLRRAGLGSIADEIDPTSESEAA